MNHLSLNSDFLLFAYSALDLISLILLFFTLAVLIVAFLFAYMHNTNKKNIFNAVMSIQYVKFPLLLVCFVFLSKAYISGKQVGTDQWLNLAQAESTLIQLQTASKIEKKPLSFDRQKSDNWIKEMREKTSSGKVNYSEYYDLAVKFNDLNIGLEDIKNWFKTNSTDSIRGELEKGLNDMVQRNQGAGQPMQPQQQPSPNQQTKSNNEDQLMEEQLMKAFS